MVNKLVIAILSISILGAADAFAAKGEKGDWELGVYTGAGFPDVYGAANPDDAVLFGGRLGYAFCNSFSLEFAGHRVFSQDVTGAAANFDAYRLNGLMSFFPGSSVRPFITVGAGLERAAMTGFHQKDAAPNVGAGIKWYPSDFGGFRLEGRYIPVKTRGALKSWEHNFEAQAGFFLTFGHRAAPKAEPMVAAAPAPEPKPEPKREPEPLKAVDSDGDGVTDDLDKCPNTGKGETVDGMGCPVVSKARGVLKGVNFKTASNVLTEEAKKVLDGVVPALNEFPGVNVEVQGHTDNTGSEATNQKLSQARAEAVAAYLESKGVTKGRLSSKGYGSAQPVADNGTAAGRKQNRRVELKWLDK